MAFKLTGQDKNGKPVSMTVDDWDNAVTIAADIADRTGKDVVVDDTHRLGRRDIVAGWKN